MKRFFITVPIIILVIISQTSVALEKLKVVASVYPLAHFAEQVGGEFAEVTNIMPAGTEPHEYEPTPRDMRRIWNSRVFLFNGAGLDPWAEKIRAELKEKGIIVIGMAEHLDLLEEDEDHHEHKHKEEVHHEEKHTHHYRRGEYDPHFWLDPLLARKEVEIIRDALIRADPENKDTYRKNAAAYINALLMLHDKYKEGLKSCKIRDIIVSHDAFGYLAGRYGLRTHSIAGISPEEEPSPRKMIEIVRVARKKNIKYIFFEILVSPKLAETIAREIGANTLVLHSVGGLTKDEISAGKTYVSVMEENLRNLRLALSCN